MNLGELEKEVFSVLSETAKTLKTELWTCVNCENPDKKASFVKVFHIKCGKFLLIYVFLGGNHIIFKGNE